MRKKMAKLSKDETKYSRGHADSHCGKVFADDTGYCKHYHSTTHDAGTCDIVEGKINPVYWCDKWQKAKQ